MNRALFLLFAAFFINPAFAIVQDEFVNSTLSDDFVKKPLENIDYNYQDTDIVPIRIQIVNDFKSEKELSEGQIIKFRTVSSSVYRRNVLVNVGTPVTSTVETIITNGMNGIPASVILGHFNVPGLDGKKISISYEKYGPDLSLLVFPLKWALTILPPTGSLTNFIKGGHVKITPNDIVTIYYHPNWN